MGLPFEYLAPTLSSSLVKAQPQLAEVILGSLAGMTVQAEIVAVLISARGVSRGFCSEVLNVTGIRSTSEGAVDQPAIAARLAKEGRGWSPAQALVAEHLRGLDHRGSDLRMTTGTLMRPSCWPRMSTNHGLWTWINALRTSWSAAAHINELELRAVLLSLKWRLRRTHAQRRLALTLVDSAVSIGVLVKRRSSSYRLHRVVRKLNALELASGTRLCFGFVRSAVNPADAPSRDATAQAGH